MPTLHPVSPTMNAPAAPEPLTCHMCGSTELREIEAYRRLGRVTSDCKAWPAGGQFAICHNCGFPQTVTNQAWRDEIARIYGSYTIYFQGAGAEQSVFDAQTGQPSLRSDLLLTRWLSHQPLAATGQLLYVGCGNGNFLRAFAKQRPAWVLDGSEWDKKYLALYQAIPSFRQLHTTALDDLTERYQVVSIIHCLEHVPNPCALLKKIHSLLADDGHLLMQVPDCAANPFMLTVSDHCSHFSTQTLANLVQACGFNITHAVNSWIPKEITLVASKTTNPIGAFPKADRTHADQLEGYIGWLAQTAQHVRACAAAAPGNFGLFGTAIAGTWLHGEIPDQVTFFVDEDPHRIGKTYLGRPVYAPNMVPTEATVYIGLPPRLAETVRTRLGPLATNWVMPPPL